MQEMHLICMALPIRKDATFTTRCLEHFDILFRNWYNIVAFLKARYFIVLLLTNNVLTYRSVAYFLESIVTPIITTLWFDIDLESE